MSVSIKGGFPRDDTTGALAITLPGGTGDTLGFYAPALIGQVLDVHLGTSAAPLTVSKPLVKASRTGAVTRATIEGVASPGTDGSDQLAALMGISLGTAAEEVQGIGVAGFASTHSTVGTPGNDACGVYGVGRALSDSNGSLGIGGVFVGRRDTDSGKTTGIELNSANYGATDGALSTAGASTTKGAWINASGNVDTGVGIQFGNAFGRQFKTGIHFNAQVTNGKTGPVVNESIRDDSTATTSLSIQGTHTSAISIGSTAGFVGVGEDPAGGAARMLVRSNGDNMSAFVAKGNSPTQNVSIFQVQSSGGSSLFFVGAGGNLGLAEGGNMILGTATGTKIGTATTQKLGFYNATPIVRPSGTPAAATDLASVIALANSMRTNLLALGLLA